MGNLVHRSEITITREKGPTRKALIKGFEEPVYYGIHGGIKKFYKIEPEEEHAATLDHMISAVAAWMMGTFAAALAKSHIKTSQDLYKADVTGDIEATDAIIKITRINVIYSLKVPEDQQHDAKVAFQNYLQFCPAAQSVINCIDIKHQLNFV